MKFAVVNAWIFFKQLKKKPRLSQYNFIKELCKQIQKKHSQNQQTTQDAAGKKRFDLLDFLSVLSSLLGIYQNSLEKRGTVCCVRETRRIAKPPTNAQNVVSTFTQSALHPTTFLSINKLVLS